MISKLGQRWKALRSARASWMHIAFCLLCWAFMGCYRQEMARQPKFQSPDLPCEFFPDGQANRPVEPGTVARGQLDIDSPRMTGLSGPGKPGAPDYLTEFPYTVDRAMLERGQQRFNIYCAVCHGPLGYGDGKVVSRGYNKPPSYHDQRLRDMPVGRIFDVITHGFGAMPDYAGQIAVDDRWAIISYVRVLQYSQNVPAAQLSDREKAKLREAGPNKTGSEGRRER